MSTASAPQPAALLQAALSYAAKGHRVVPLHSLTAEGHCTCSRGAQCDRSPGKHPRTRRGLEDASCDPAQIRQWWAEWPTANVGIVTGAISGIVVFDIDGEEGERSLQQITERFGEPPRTLTARTGGGGRHLVFRAPAGGRKVANRQRLGGLPRIDVRGDGGYIVAPPSLHSSGRLYEWIVDTAPAADAWFMRVYDTLDAELRAEKEKLRQQAGGAAVLPYRRPGEDRRKVLERARAYLEKMEPAISGQAGHDATIKAAAAMVRGFSLAVDEAYDLLASVFNPRCVPPWSPADLRRKCEEVRDKSELPWGYLLEAGAPLPMPRTRRLLRPLEPQKAGKEEGEEQTAEEPAAVPAIQVNGRQLIDVIEEAWSAILAGNEPPQLFRRGGALIRIRHDSDVPVLSGIGTDELHGLLLRLIEWVKVSQGKDGETEMRPAKPDKDLVRDMLALPRAEVPRLDGIVTSPVLIGDGELLLEPGYSPRAELWYHEQHGFSLSGPIPGRPTWDDMVEALDLLLVELLGDFPFESQADRAAALACMLLPFARRMIDGCTPLHLISAPSSGSGKGLLADVISIIALGHPAHAMQLPGDEEAARKALFAELAGGPPLILLDNVSEYRRVNSPALASVLTSREPKDRVLGLSQMITVRNDAVWLMTGNNPQLSLEIARRCVRIRIDPKMDMPWMRTGFRHEDLRGWAGANRGALVHACLTMLQFWLVEGRPLSAQRLGTYEEWSALMGGVLECAGIEGLLAGSAKLYEEVDEEGRAWRELVAAWWEWRRGIWTTCRELIALAVEKNLVPEVLGDKGERSQQTRMGKALARMAGRVFCGRMIIVGADSHTKTAQYRLDDSYGAGECVAGDGGSDVSDGAGTGGGADAGWSVDRTKVPGAKVSAAEMQHDIRW